MELIEIFETLARIPSPSLHEGKVADEIIKIMQGYGISAKKDKTGNVVIKVCGTDKNKKPLILSSHMDVVGDNSPVNIVYNGDFIETDKKRTLGADDKSGVAVCMKLALDIKDAAFSHGGLEIILTRDEEQGMLGINGVEFETFEGEDILVLDSDKLGNFEISGAGYTKLTLSVTTPFGGHSGLDIADKTKLNAAKLTAEIVNKIPQGVYKSGELGVITSINLGSIVAGAVDNSVYAAVENKIDPQEAAQYVCHNSMSNLINTTGFAHYSIRSSSKEYEIELINKIQEIINEFNAEYKDHAHAEICVSERLPIFEKSNDNRTIDIARSAGEKSGIKVNVQSFHAGAETHIYANKKNKNGVSFRPVLAGIADIYNMHSRFEKIDVKSYKKGYHFIKEFFTEYNK